MKTLSYKFKANSDYTVREEVYQGKKYMVVPVTMMVEGVHHGSAGPLFHSITELGKIPESWNGRPVTIQHPEEDGIMLSANSPEVAEMYSVGFVFNTYVHDKALKAEAWLDIDRLRKISMNAYEYINSHSPLEISLGMFSEEDMVEGDWNGEHYIGVSHSYRPDHLALLPDGVGACSWKDGCGVRVNKKKGGDDVLVTLEGIQLNALSYSGTETSRWNAPTLSDFGVDGNWDSLSRTEKSRIASHFLIGSASVDTFEELKLPVVSASTDKLNENALRAVISGRGSQVSGVSADQKNAARRRAYRLLNSEFDANLTIPSTLSAMKELNNDGLFAVEVYVQGDLKALVQNLQTKLDRMDDDIKVHFLEAVYSDYVIYEVHVKDGSKELYKRTYTADQDSNITFTGDPIQVRRDVNYVALQQTFKRTKFNTNKKEDVNMPNGNECQQCKEKVLSLISNETTKFTAEDEEWLMGLEESQLDKLIPEKKKEPETNKSGKLEEKSEPVTVEAYLETVPEEIRDQIQTGLRLNTAKRKRLVEYIMNNAKAAGWSEDKLKTKSTEDLELIANSIIKPVDYSGQGASPIPEVNNGGTAEFVPEPMPLTGIQLNAETKQ